MPSRLKIGIIGLGFGGAVHVPAFRQDLRCQVIAIAGRNKEKAANLAKDLEIPNSSDDWRRIIENREIGAVSIAVPPYVQPEIVEAALHAGKHVFCEKPLAPSAVSAARLFRLAASKGLVHAVDFIFPELQPWIEARERIRSGAIGAVRHVSLDWSVETYAARMNLDSWKNDPVCGGGVLNNFVSHVVHNIEWMIGRIDYVSAILRGPVNKAETRVNATLDLEGEVPVFLSVASDAFLGSGHRIFVYGESGTLALENPTSDYASGFQLRVGTRDTVSLNAVTVDRTQPGIDGRIAPVARIASRFCDAIFHGVIMSPDFANGLRAQCILDTMRLSNESNRRMATDSLPPA